MKFADILATEEPAYEVFKAAHACVFDKEDGATEHIDRLTQEARLVYLLWCFDGEIHNGGFDQLFHNSLGNHSAEILANLEVVGAMRSRDLLARAMKWFPNRQPPVDRKERWDQCRILSIDPAFEAELNALDAEFYKYEDNLSVLVNAYVASQPHAMVRCGATQRSPQAGRAG